MRKVGQLIRIRCRDRNKEKADLGIAFDGDGDRVIMVDHRGNVVDGDEILYLIARDRRRQVSTLGASSELK